MKILVINAGSSSIKYQLIDVDAHEVIAKGQCDRIGIGGSEFIYEPTQKTPYKRVLDVKDHVEAIKLLLDALVDPEIGVISDMGEIDAVGHRIVHGGEKFTESVILTDEVLEGIESLSELAPLHNPKNLMGIRACKALMPNIPMVGVFDTAFHQTMPKKAYIYALPYDAYAEHMVRRYGFHGTSHNYVAFRAIQMLGKPVEDTKIITCHLGNGSSVCAIKGGRCIDTSMGFTPAAGLPMGTRCGDIDPAIIIYLMKKLGMNTDEMDAYINEKSGMLGIHGELRDFRDLAKAAGAGDELAELALSVFAYDVKKYIGAYVAALNGVDAIVFTAGIGANDFTMRKRILTDLDYLGIDFDFERNKAAKPGKEAEITKEGSRVKVFVIPTNEEMMIAKETARLVKQ